MQHGNAPNTGRRRKALAPAASAAVCYRRSRDLMPANNLARSLRAAIMVATVTTPTPAPTCPGYWRSTIVLEMEVDIIFSASNGGSSVLWAEDLD